MLRRFWCDVGLVERYLNQPWTAIKTMTLREFKFHVLAACHWLGREGENSPEE